MVVVALVVATTWKFWPRERLLMEVARPVVKINPYTDYFWLSVHQLLILTSKRTTANSVVGFGQRTTWKVAADILDTTTGAKTHLSRLTSVLLHASVPVSAHPFDLSPDGKWLQWTTWTTTVVRRKYNCIFSTHVVRIDGTHYRTWTYNGGLQYSFYPDSGHLVQITTHEPRMIVRDLLDPARDQKYLSPTPRMPILVRHAVQQPVWREVDVSDQNVAKGHAVIETYTTQDRLGKLFPTSIRKQPGMKPFQTHSVNLPLGASAGPGETSPQQQSVLFDLSIEQTNPPLSWLHRVLPKLKLNSTLTEGLWVSRIDGREMHEIGHVPINDDDRDFKGYVSDPKWLSDGNQISFVYDDTLYVVPAVIDPR